MVVDICRRTTDVRCPVALNVSTWRARSSSIPSCSRCRRPVGDGSQLRHRRPPAQAGALRWSGEPGSLNHVESRSIDRRGRGGDGPRPRGGPRLRRAGGDDLLLGRPGQGLDPRSGQRVGVLHRTGRRSDDRLGWRLLRQHRQPTRKTPKPSPPPRAADDWATVRSPEGPLARSREPERTEQRLDSTADFVADGADGGDIEPGRVFDSQSS